MKFDCGCELTKQSEEDENGDLHDYIDYEPCKTHRPVWEAEK